MIEEYLAAFAKHYPHHSVKVKPVRGKRHGDETRFAVYINGERGDITLSQDDIRSAIRMFNR
jgi:hypothetical protein